MFHKKNRYFSIGLTLLCVVMASALFIVILSNLNEFFAVVTDFFQLISSVLFGLVFAYLMNPIMKAVEKPLLKWFSKGNMTEKTAKNLSRGLGVLVALLVFLLVIYALVASVVPEVIASLQDLLSPENLDSYYTKITDWTNNVIQGTPLEGWFDENGGSVLNYVQNWLTERVDIASAITVAAEQVISLFKSVFNVLIGVVAAVYMLISKDKFQAQAKKLTVAVFRPATADRVLELARRTNKIFGGFAVGKIIDSCIIGVLCYIGMSILRLPYTMLVSALVGVTNVVPFFGPLVGIACGTILILFQSPMQALYFLIFGIVLQQIDGNIIGPRILGGRLGISDFWILVSITVFGGLFGFVGMLIGVPMFTLIHSLISDAVNKSLEKKQQPLRTDYYYDITTVEDLEKYQAEFSESTVFYSEDTFDTEFDPDDELEINDQEE